MTNSIKRTTIKNLVAATNGKIFTVTHLRKAPKLNKETGVIEKYNTMSCRTGVTKHLKGGVSTIAGKDDLVGVYKMDGNKQGGYRCFSADIVKNITVQGVEYNFEDC